ncbi:MAG: peptidoglycan-binding protein [Mobilicoccus sp.]|nr:peptidoglycan-binding protein [Mobilicoccus sp.]
MNVRRGPLLWLVGLVLAGAAGTATGVLIGEEQAATSPTTPPPVTVAVQRRELRDVLTLSCQVQRRTSPISFVPPGEAPAVVTGLPSIDRLTDGGVLAEVSGRPVITLTGAFGLYRDLAPGDEGPDVRMLQEALHRLDMLDRVDGHFGPATSRALERLYRRHGYGAPTREIAAPAEPVPADGTTPPTPPDTAPPAASTTRTIVVAARSELTFLRNLPHRLAARPPVGTRLGETLGSIDSDDITAACNGTRSREAAPGQTVAFPDGVTGHIASAPARTDADTVPTVPVTLSGATSDLAQGQSITGEVVLAATAGPQLVVPVAAVGGIGATGTVTVVGEGGEHSVPVTVGVVADGFVEVTPAADAALAEGDLVVIGVGS